MAVDYNTGVLQASFEYSLDGRNYTNQVHYKQASTDTAPFSLAANAPAIGADLVSIWSDNIQAITVDAMVLNNIRLTVFDRFLLMPTIPPAPVGTPQQLTPNPAEQADYTSGLPMSGTITTDYLPAFNSFRARKLTGLPGRRRRGHNSIAGVPEAATTGNKLDDGDWSVWQTNAPAFFAHVVAFSVGLQGYTLLPCVFSVTTARAEGAALPVCALYAYAITNVIPNRLVGTMRRRKKKTV